MDRTQFAGLTRLDPSDPLSVDGYSFQARNPAIIDHFLKLVVTHRHDAHPALATPTVEPTVTINNAGGQIPSDTTITVGYTLLDQDGGETVLIANPPTGSTQAGMTDPTGMPTLALNTAAGTLLANTYSYAATVTDGAGGETALSTVSSIDVPPGSAHARIVISGLQSIVTDAGGVGWRLWRSVGGGMWALVASSVDNALDGVTDDGSLAVDCGVTPPSVTGTTRATSQLVVTVPVGQPNDAVGFNIYASIDGTFSDPCLLGSYPMSDAGVAKTYNSLAFLPGAPPEVATAVPGSELIVSGGGGGGGGGGGALKLLPPESVTQTPMARGSRLPDYAITFDNTWALLAVLVGGQWGVGLDIASGTDYAPAQFDGDTASFGMVAPGGALTTVGTPSGEQIIVAKSSVVALGTDGYAEFDYAPVGNGWDTMMVGVADATYPTAQDGVAVMIDRAAGTLSLVSITSIDPLAFTVLTSIGAADGYTPPASGDTGTIYFQQWTNRVWGIDSRFPTLMLEAAIPAGNTTGGGGINRGLLGASWTVAGDLRASYAGFYPLPHRRQVRIAGMGLTDRPTDQGVAYEVNTGNTAVALVAEGDELQAVTFENGWLGSLWWRKAPKGPLEIYGTAHGGTAGLPIFTLPTPFDSLNPYRPTLVPLRVPIVTDTGPSFAEIGTDGTVTPDVGAGNSRLDFAVTVPAGW